MRNLERNGLGLRVALLAVLSGCSVKSGGSDGRVDPSHDGGSTESPPQMSGDPATEADGGGAPMHDAGSASQPDAGSNAGSDAGNAAPVPVIMSEWPGGAPSTADDGDSFGGNLSGLTFQAASTSAPDVLWAVRNNPPTLFRLERGDDGTWRPNAPSDGRQLLFPNGDGEPDAEGVTLADGPAIYVSSERDGQRGDESRPSILRYESSGTGALTATHEWLLKDDLPQVDANEGPEAVTWVPDAYLTLHHFRDQTRNEPYDPTHYPGHGSGLFFVGLEANGMIYAYALNHDDSSALRVASLTSGHPQVMGLEFDREQGMLWAQCDDGCGNRTSVLTIEAGQFELRALFDPPAELADLNNEGIAFSDCHGGQRTFFWTDDNETNGHAIRVSVMPCAPF